MKVSKSWLQELVDIKSMGEVERLLPLRTIATKEITEDFIELDMKGYNRSDLLSMRGVAYEISAITDSKVTFTEDDTLLSPDSKLHVDIQNPDLVPIYCLVKIEGLKVGNAPESWKKKLTDSGIRSVNNVTDITNLVMLEYGQPLHAFDASTVESESIIVRNANHGEKLVTLDSKERTLNESDILITDSEKVLGIAGVMGGKNSEINDNTTSILLEAAIFDPASLRKTATRLSLQSEASKRFYHGLTKKRLFQALNAAILMYRELGGNVCGFSIIGNKDEPLKTVKLNREKVNSLIGVEIPAQKIEEYLEKLHFSIDGSKVTPPYWRKDIEIEEDLIEEVARMYGYENIEAKKLTGELPEKIDQSIFELISSLKQTLVDLGLTEVQTYSFYSTQTLKALGANDESKQTMIKVANPMSAETEYLRQYIWPNLVEVIAKNLKQGFEDIAIFEVGKVYFPPQKESYRLAIALTNNDQDNVLELAAILKQAFEKLKLPLSIEQGELMKGLEEIFHPTKFATVKSGEKTLGGLAEVHPRLTFNYGIDRKRVSIVEIELDKLKV